MRWNLFILVVAVHLLTCTIARAQIGAWDYVPLTVSEWLEQGDSAIYGKLVGSTPGKNSSFGKSSPAKLSFEVVEILRDSKQKLRVGQKVSHDSAHAGKLGDHCLFLDIRPGGVPIGVDPEDRDADLRMESWAPISPALLKYMKETPHVDVASTTRLKFFVQYLEHPDPDIAADACLEFSNANFKDFIAIKSDLPREKLRQWIKDPRMLLSGRLEVYGTLLGVCGTDEDAELIWQVFRTPQEAVEVRRGLHGLLIGYLLLRNEAGLKVIEQSVFKDPKMQFVDLYAGVQTLMFFSTVGRDTFPPDRLKTSMRMLLDQPEVASIALVYLMRWKDWSVMDRALELSKRPEYDANRHEFTRATLKYLFAARHDRLNYRGEPTPAHVTKAEACLAGLKRRDPETFADVERHYGSGR